MIVFELIEVIGAAVLLALLIGIFALPVAYIIAVAINKLMK